MFLPKTNLGRVRRGFKRDWIWEVLYYGVFKTLSKERCCSIPYPSFVWFDLLTECKPSFFKASVSNEACKPCPKNTHPSSPGALSCPCLEGFYRAPEDPLTVACSGENIQHGILTNYPNDHLNLLVGFSFADLCRITDLFHLSCHNLQAYLHLLNHWLLPQPRWPLASWSCPGLPQETQEDALILPIVWYVSIARAVCVSPVERRCVTNPAILT